MIEQIELPNPADDGLTHINTDTKSRSPLGRILSLNHVIPSNIRHPYLGPFCSVENLWVYLNSGGTHDKMRSIPPHIARARSRFLPKYSCNHFWDLVVDVTLLKLATNSYYEQLVVHNQLPYDHYYLENDDAVPVRPKHSESYVSCLQRVESILRGNKQHKFVRFSDLEYKLLP